MKLPPNARNGYATTLKGAGDDVFYDGGHVRRDVTVIVEEAPHADLQRVGADLLCAKRVPLLDALTGFAIEVPTLRRDDKRGKAFVVRADAADLPVAPDDVWILKGEGMRDSSGARGDLLIRFVVEFPKTLPDEKDRRGRLAPLLGGSAAAPTPPSKRGLFGGLFGGASADELAKLKTDEDCSVNIEEKLKINTISTIITSMGTLIPIEKLYFKNTERSLQKHRFQFRKLTVVLFSMP